MRKLYISALVLFICLFFSSAYAQPRKGEFINVNAGLGLVAPDDDSELTGDGFYAQAEYVWSPTSWFGLRPYAGLVIASGESDKADIAQTGVKEYIRSNAFMLGGKVRLAAPIPYVAPFFETGVGMSIGSFRTYTQYTHLKKSGALLHIPVSFGLAIGRKHSTEIKFTYYFHEAPEQYSGAIAVGFTIPLNE